MSDYYFELRYCYDEINDFFIGCFFFLPDLSLVYQVVAAIDFGTTYSGYAYSWKDKQDRFHTIKSSTKFSEKEPSVLLMDQSEELVAFGHEAELKYKDLCEEELQQNYFYFQHFKMNLHRDEVKTFTQRVLDSYN